MARIRFYKQDSGYFTIRISHGRETTSVTKGLNFYVDPGSLSVDGSSIMDTKDERLKELMLKSRYLVESVIPNRLRDRLCRPPVCKEIAEEYQIEMGVKARLVDSKEDRANTPFFDVWDRFLSYSKENVGSSSYSERDHLNRLFKGYCKDKGIAPEFGMMDEELFLDLQSYCRQEFQSSDNTIGKYFKGIKTFLNWARKRKYTTTTAHTEVKVTSIPADIVVYTEEELQNIIDLDLFDRPDLEHSRDIMLAGCFTGLRVGDLLNLSPGSVYLNDMVPSKSYLRIAPKKTKNKTLVIPIASQLYHILKKYKGQYKNALPTHNSEGRVIDDKRFRSDIREISEFSGIMGMEEKRVMRNGEYVTELVDRSSLFSPHRMRATFITIMLKAGVPAEQVMTMSGHSTYSSFKRYVQFTDQDNEKAIDKAFDKFSRTA